MTTITSANVSTLTKAKRRRTHLNAEVVVAVALDMLGVERAELLSDERSHRLTLAREAVVGAITSLVNPAPSYPEIAAMLGRGGHAGTHTQHQRFLSWPEVLRRYWLDMVRANAERSR